jgi:signal transduction histidine kinase
LGSNLAAAELTGFTAAAFFAVYWLRGGRAWLLPAGIGHLFIAAIYVYLLLSPVGIPPRTTDARWVTLTLPLCLVAANGFLFFALLQLLERAPPARTWAAWWLAAGLAVIAVQATLGAVVAFCLAVASSAVVGPVVAVLLMARGTLFYVIVGALLLVRILFQVVVTYYGAFDITPALVGVLIFINLGAVVGDGFGLILIEYDDTRRQLAEAGRAKTAFLASISHELRTPLNAIIGFAELIGQQSFGAIDQRYRGYADNILASGRGLLGVVNQVLEMTDIEADRIRFDMQRLDLADVVRDVLGGFGPAAQEKGIDIRTAFPPAVVETVGDRRAIHRVVASLIDNAIKFSRPGGHVDVSVAATPEQTARLVVADHGIGMSAAEVRDAFKPFLHNADVYSRGHGGLGLGLAVSHRLVAAMGGKVLVESIVGQGSTFTVVLPSA